MNTRTLLILAAAGVVSGCASSLNTAGKADYACPGMPSGVVCKTPAAVYKSTHQEPAATEFDVPIGKTVSIPAAAPAAAQQAPRNIEEGVLVQPLASSPRINGPRPVREPAQVARIWIAPWVDKSDNLHLATIHYTEVRPRTWTVGKPEVTSAPGYVVPHRALAPTSTEGQQGSGKPSTSALPPLVEPPLPAVGAGVVRPGGASRAAEDLPPPPN